MEARESLDLTREAWEIVLTTWYEGPYGNRDGWAVYRLDRPEESSRYAIRFLDYLSRFPKEAPEDPEIHIASRFPEVGMTVEADAETIERVLRSGGAITVPFIGINHNIGVDGCTRGLRFKPEDLGYDLSWWGEGPDEWRPLTLWTEHLQDLLHAILFPEAPHYDRGEVT
jgi:hypothetical protein